MKKFTILKSFAIVAGVMLAMSGWGQTPFTATYTFGADGNVASFAYNGTSYDGIIPGNILKVGVTTSSSSGNFRATGWPLDPNTVGDLDGVVDFVKYIGFNIEAANGYKFTVTSIAFGVGRSGTGTRQSQWRGSNDSYGSIINNYTSLNAGLTNSSGVLTNPDLNSSWTGNVLTLGSGYADITGSVGFRYYLYNSEAVTGTAGLQGPITISGTFEIAGINTPPSITNIVQLPSETITSSTSVSVSADVTDPDGTVVLVELRWGTTAGVYLNTIAMLLDAGNTYTINSNIPPQTDGTTVYYVIYAEDDDEAPTTSPEQSYTVFDPPGLPYAEDFSGFISSVTLPEEWSVSNNIYEGDWGTGTGAGLRGNANVLGFQHTSGTGVFTATLTLLNNTGETIEELFISYLGMVERAGEGRSPEWTVELNGVVIPGLFYSTVDGVDKSVSALIQGLSIADNEFVIIKWSSDRGLTAGASKQIGIGDVSVSMTESFLLIGAADDASNYATWSNNDNAGYGFGPWTFTTAGNAGFFLGNPVAAGISNMDNPSFGLYANPAGNNFANADRAFISPLGVGSTFSVEWAVNWDSDGSGNKGINLYAGGTSGTQIININMGGTAAITINGNPMFNNYGTQVMTLNFEYVSEGQLRVYGTGRDGTESYDQTISVAAAPDAVRFYASGLAGGDQRQPYFNNLKIETDASGIPNDATVFVIGQPNLNQDLVIDNLIIEAGNALTIGSTSDVTVNGLLTNDAGTSGLVINSGGSLIHNSTGIQATAERYIALAGNWGTGADGWHFLSSPVAAQAISGVWTPTGSENDYDFFAWEESQVEFPWLNQKDISNETLFNLGFIPGKGYLVAYEQTGTKTFVGALNSGAINFELKNTGVTKNWVWTPGWNMLGNPYPSAIDWSLATKTQFQDNFAYVYNTNKPGGAGYVTIDGSLANAFIPANQGFFVSATSAANNQNFTFTNDIRAHGGTFYKSGDADKLTLQLARGEYYDNTTIRIREQSSLERDRNDALKMFSFNTAIPQVYSRTADDVWVAVNSIPEINETLTIPLSIKVPANGTMTLSIAEFNGVFADQKIFLVDLLTNITHNFSQHPEYSFTANTSDSPARFLLKFSAVGIPEVPGSESLQAWVNGNMLYVMNTGASKASVEVFNMHGQLVMVKETAKGLQSLPANVPPGTYLVRMTSEGATATRKISIQ